jgi:oxygen-independent coproporphyrinogen-3 oxidase
MRLSSDDELRAGLIQSLMCQGTISVRQIEERHGMRFTEYFAAELARLQPLADDGLVLIGPEQIEVTDHGRLLLRNIAMCFDRYLAPQPKDEKPRFSQAI